MKKWYVLMFLIGFNLSAVAQKIMIKQDGSILNIVSHKDYGSYHAFQITQDGEWLYIPDKDLQKIIDDPGFFPDQLMDELFSLQRIHNLKFSLTGFTNQSFIILYEQPLSLKWHMEGGIKFHTGTSNNFPFHETGGTGVELGAKYLITNPKRMNKSGKLAHRMNHVYIKPTIGYSNRDERGFEDIDEYEIFYVGSNLGTQFVISGIVTLDVFAGAYYYTGSGTSTPSRGNFTIPINLNPNEGDFNGDNNFATSLGVRVGFLF